MPKTAASRRYARALFALAGEEARVEAVREELAGLVRLIDETPELRNVIYRPLHPVAERRAALDALVQRLGLGTTFRHFCVLLLEQGRMVSLPEVRSEYERLADEAAGRVPADVVAAAELAPDQIERLRRALAARTGRDVQIQLRIDPSIVGGVVARVGDLVFDGSLRTQLAQLRSTLMKGR